MKNNKKIIIASIGLIVIGMYYFYKQGKQDAQVAVEPTSPFGSTKNLGSNNASLPVKSDWNKILKKGSTGQEVGILQTALGGGLKVDNDFGSLTEARLNKITGTIETSLNQYNAFFKK